MVRTYANEKSTFMPVEDLRQSQMMAHMLEALDNGEDIRHYNRLVFAMIGGHFVSNDELVELLTKDHDADKQEIRAMDHPRAVASLEAVDAARRAT
jgi:hypothetical protein